MKKNIFFIVIAAMSQMFCGNMLGQTTTANTINIINPQYSSITAGSIYSNNVEHGLVIKETLSRGISFWTLDNYSGVPQLQLKSGGGVAPILHFPRQNITNWITTASEGNIGFKVTNATKTSLFIKAPSGNVGIGTENPSQELTVSGDVEVSGWIQSSMFNTTVMQAMTIETSQDVRSPLFTINNGGGISTSSSNYNAMAIYGAGTSLTGGAIYLYSRQKSVPDMVIRSTGNVGIGITDPSERLTVNGNIKLDNGKLFININPNNINATVKNKYSIFATGGVLSEDYAIAPQSTWADHVFNTDYNLQSLTEIENYIRENKHLPNIPSAVEVKENGYTLHDMNVKLLQKVEELTLYTIEQNKEIEQLKKVVNSYQSLLEKVEKLENRIDK